MMTDQERKMKNDETDRRKDSCTITHAETRDEEERSLNEKLEMNAIRTEKKRSDPTKWKANKRKLKRVLGAEYLTKRVN